VTVTTTTRFGVYRWSSDSDALTRTQIDESHKNVEFYMAKMLSGTAVPTVGLASYSKTIFLNQANNRIYYYTTDDSSGQWVYVETDVISSTLANAKGDTIVASARDRWGALPVGLKNQILAVVDNSKTVTWSTVLTQKGDLLTLDSGSLSRVSAGQQNQVLHANSSLFGGVGYSAVSADYLASGSISTDKINNNSIVTSKIVNSAITSLKVSSSSVSTPKIADLSVSSSPLDSLAVTNIKFSDSAIAERNIGNFAVTTSIIQNEAVTESKILGGAVTTSKLANFSVTESKLASDSVSSSKISSSAVGTSALAENSVTGVKISNNSVTTENINNLAVVTEKILSNSVTGAKIATGSVGPSQLADGAATSVKFGNLQVTGSKINAAAVTSSKIENESVTSPKIGGLAVSSPKYSTNAVSGSRFRQSSATSIIGNASNTLANVSDIVASNDNVVLRRSGNFLSFGTAQTQNFADLSVTSTSVLDGSISDVQVGSSANIALSKLGVGVLPAGIKVDTANYLDGSVTLPKLSSDRTEEGVAVWLDYVPVVSLNSGGTTNLTAQQINVRHAKYMKINGLCLVNVQVQLVGVTAATRKFFVSLPLAPLTPDLQPVGTAVFINVDTPNNNVAVQPVIFSGRLALVEAIRRLTFSTTQEDLFVGFTSSENDDLISFSIAYEVAT
jgi:hypothetical protein